MLKAIWGFAVLSMTLVITTIAFGGKNAKSDIPPHGEAVVLFNGRDLTNFDTFLKEHGLNNDPDHVFLVENGVIHISGKEFGYVITKKEFANYYLRAEFKWGEGTYAPREGQARDSGILYHVQGEQKVWPRSVEFQIIEGGTRRFLDDGWRGDHRARWCARDWAAGDGAENRSHRQRAVDQRDWLSRSGG